MSNLLLVWQQLHQLPKTDAKSWSGKSALRQTWAERGPSPGSHQGKPSAEPSPASTRAAAHTGRYLAPPVFMQLTDKTFHHHLKSIIYPWEHKRCNLHTTCLHLFPQDCSMATHPSQTLLHPGGCTNPTGAGGWDWGCAPPVATVSPAVPPGKGHWGGQKGVGLSVQC